MISINDFQSMKRKVEQLQREVNRAEGVLEQLSTELREKFGDVTLEQARELLAKRRRKEVKLAGGCEEMLKKLKEDYPHVFKELE